MNRIVLAFVLCAAAASAAHADSKAWTAAKKVLPSGLDIVGGMSAGTVRASKLYQQMLPKLLASNKDVSKVIDMLHATCSIDAPDVIDSVVAGMTADKVVVVATFKGLVQKDFEACLDKLSKEQDKKPMAIAKVGNLVKYGDGTDSAYGRWLAKDTLAFTGDPADKDLLTKLTAGGITGDKTLKTALSAVKTDSAVWMVANKNEDLDQVHAKMSQAYGWADLKSGTIAPEVHIVVDSAKVAKDAAASANQQIDAVKKSGQLPPVFDPLVKALGVKSAGSEMIVTAAMTEGEVLSLVQAALALSGH